MKLEKMAAIAEIVSSIAIVLTLIYLAIQTQQLTIQAQQTNSALLAGSREATMIADVTLMSARLANPEIGVSIQKNEITDLERVALGSYLAGLLRVREFAWFQYQAGIMDEANWESYIAPLARIFNTPQGAIIWSDLSPELDPEFASHIQQLIDVRAGD